MQFFTGLMSYVLVLAAILGAGTFAVQSALFDSGAAPSAAERKASLPPRIAASQERKATQPLRPVPAKTEAAAISTSLIPALVTKANAQEVAAPVQPVRQKARAKPKKKSVDQVARRTAPQREVALGYAPQRIDPPFFSAFGR